MLRLSVFATWHWHVETQCLTHGTDMLRLSVFATRHWHAETQCLCHMTLTCWDSVSLTHSIDMLRLSVFATWHWHVETQCLCQTALTCWDSVSLTHGIDMLRLSVFDTWHWHVETQCLCQTALTCRDSVSLLFRVLSLHRFSASCCPLLTISCPQSVCCFGDNCLIGLVVKVSVMRTEDPKFDSCLLRRDFSGLSYTSDFKIGYPAKCLALLGQCWDWLAWCQHTANGWGRKFRGFRTRMVYLKHVII